MGTLRAAATREGDRNSVLVFIAKATRYPTIGSLDKLQAKKD
jgi:hypothetical protein